MRRRKGSKESDSFLSFFQTWGNEWVTFHEKINDTCPAFSHEKRRDDSFLSLPSSPPVDHLDLLFLPTLTLSHSLLILLSLCLSWARGTWNKVLRLLFLSSTVSVSIFSLFIDWLSSLSSQSVSHSLSLSLIPHHQQSSSRLHSFLVREETSEVKERRYKKKKKKESKEENESESLWGLLSLENFLSFLMQLQMRIRRREEILVHPSSVVLCFFPSSSSRCYWGASCFSCRYSLAWGKRLKTFLDSFIFRSSLLLLQVLIHFSW